MVGFSAPIPSSSNAFISGEPWVLNKLMKSTLDFPNLVASALYAAAQEEEDRIRRTYANYGISADVFVKYDVDNSKFIVQASGSEVVEAEYGGPTSTARAILRKTVIRDTPNIKKSIEKSIEKGLKV
jgi:hypothetical protein